MLPAGNAIQEEKDTKYTERGERSMSDIVFAIVFVGFIAVLIGLAVLTQLKQSKYVKDQKESGSDKKKMMDAMARAMQERQGEYTYAVGNYTQIERYGKKTTYYYFSYILAFNPSELIIFPFVVKDGELILRKCMNVVWNDVKFTYKLGKKGIDLTIGMGKEKLMINVPEIQKSSGVENSAEPLCVHQEAETQRLAAYLPQYQAYTTQ